MHGCVRQEGIEHGSKCSIHANGVIYEQGSIWTKNWTEPSPCSTISEASGLRALPTTSPGRSRAKANRDKSWCSHISCAAAAMLPACLSRTIPFLMQLSCQAVAAIPSLCVLMCFVSRKELAKVVCLRVKSARSSSEHSQYF